MSSHIQASANSGEVRIEVGNIWDQGIVSVDIRDVDGRQVDHIALNAKNAMYLLAELSRVACDLAVRRMAR